MKADFLSSMLLLANTLLLSAILAGCSSAPPPAPVPEARRQAYYAASVAVKLSQAENWKAAEKQWLKTADLFALIHDRTNQAIAWHNLAQAERELGQHNPATNWLENASRLNQLLNQTNEWWRNQIVLLQIELEMDRTNALETRFEELNRRLPLLTAPDIRGLYLLERCQWEIQRGDYNQAGISLQQGAAGFVQAGMSNGLAAAEVRRAQLYRAQGQAGQAILAWRAALAQYETLADASGVAISLEGLGGSLMDHQELQAAEEVLKLAVNNNRVLRKERALVSSLQALIECCKRQNKPIDTLAAELKAIDKTR